MRDPAAIADRLAWLEPHMAELRAIEDSSRRAAAAKALAEVLCAFGSGRAAICYRTSLRHGEVWMAMLGVRVTATGLEAAFDAWAEQARAIARDTHDAD